MPKLIKKDKKRLQMQTKKLLEIKTRSPSVSSFESEQPVARVKVENETQLRNQLMALQKKLEALSAKNVESCSDDTENVDPSEKQNQLFGKYYKDEEMVLLRNEIYCRKRIYEMAIGSSYKSSHVARRLLEGVFKRETLLKSTLTGQSPKSQGKERQMIIYESLNKQAIEAIIEFSIEWGLQRKWSSQNQYDLNRALSQKIGEIKRHYKCNI